LVENNIEVDLKEVGLVMGWIHLDRDSVQ
jgi:hypothetical protein